MPDQRENLPVRTNRDGDGLNITPEELRELWKQYIEEDDDRQPGEMTRIEAAELWGIPTDSAYDRLEKLVSRGLMTKRIGRKTGRRTTYYNKVG
jgi:hypothetical protein